jgi:drug/metabolite transporter (DMT)-like permease
VPVGLTLSTPMETDLRNIEPPAKNGAPERRATLIGATAIVLWSTLALITTYAAALPPFQLTAMSFAVAAALALLKWRLTGERMGAHLRQPAAAWALGVFGLFGYHALYFSALAAAPAADASLIAYLWPLLIVLFAGFLPGERLAPLALLGAALGLAGTGLLVLGSGLAFKVEYALGYALALGCALTWSSYSVLSRRMRSVPTDAVGGFCGATAILALGAHLLFEPSVLPDAASLMAALLLGVGPVGAAFYAWDIGVKHGDIRLLGVLSYGAPILSTVLLVLFGRAEPSLELGVAATLVAGGAALAGLRRSR